MTEIRTCGTVMPREVIETGDFEGVADRRFLWPQKSILTIGFLDGGTRIRERVKAAIMTVQPYINLTLKFVATPKVPPLKSHIQITFAPGGSWSVVGTTATQMADGTPTMQLGWLRDDTVAGEVHRVTVHEFLHAIGVLHEHQSPVGGVQWNKQAVYDYYTKTQGWDKATIDANIFQTYESEMRAGQLIVTPFDKASIMLYPIPAGLAYNVVSDWNGKLSAGDIATLRAMYPK